MVRVLPMVLSHPTRMVGRAPTAVRTSAAATRERRRDAVALGGSECRSGKEEAVDFDIDELAADPRYVHIRVCVEHGGLYDDRPDPETGRQQRCHDRGAELTWHGYDFNQWI
jgi:hypothetical protein